ncbi:RluA family pseudouridine synthase [Candidatus Liberibacter solanacearum]|uniref:Pseudouridine synthase n=1 Tax=Candidatus Liberibacter solanacearum TaxID=556287 RepID=A0A1V2N8G4_9HYPH|nr:RluA family pseudouridine synthase [Candidatus Liberibacter solanacearum]ONI59764.1 RNA pseudouridine synthase [Candidatus Liberibacter solanacearum]ONI59993.1 RNA pseudouridine synthase [Candidatus Liberibacter solanacearum]
MRTASDNCLPMKISLLANNEAEGRIDRWLAMNLKEEFSRSYVKTLILNGAISINGVVSINPSRKVVPGESFFIDVPPLQQLNIAAENIPLDILYEDDDIIVINKKAGLVVHPAPGNWTGTLVNALLHHCNNNLSGINGIKRPGIVHRLDKDTTGTMVVAKNDIAHQRLSEQFADHGLHMRLKRSYYAMVWGVPSPDSGTINAPLGRCKSNRLRRAVKRIEDKTGDRAVTHYQTVEIYNKNSNFAASLLRCDLETGRTHQIRVHMAHKGYPIIGDPLYGKGFKTKENIVNHSTKSAILSLARQALHAYSLSFAHPCKNKDMNFKTPIPEDMSNVIKELKEN